MKNKIKPNILFVLFFVSGFCGLLYQVVWLRMAYSVFGIITPVLSVVLSVFMGGLALGSWLGGNLSKKLKVHPMIIYGSIELFIGLGAFLIPRFFSCGGDYLLQFGQLDSFGYLLRSAGLITISILPWCICMGATFPFVMAYIEKYEPRHSSSFSYLYLANVIGAMAGAGLTALVLVELLGFQKSLLIAAAGNFSIALISLLISASKQKQNAISRQPPVILSEQKALNPVFIGTVLFITGFCSMSLEVVWTRAFTPILTTTIYAFAAMLTVYLFATWVGSFLYRLHLQKNAVWSVTGIINWLVLSSILPLILNDPRMHPKTKIVFISLFPFCFLLGYLTPQLIDYFSKGDSKKGGKVYAINILGCVLGPLFAGYILLPLVGVKWGFVVLSIPFLFIALYAVSCSEKTLKNLFPIALSALFILVGIFINKTYEDGDFYVNGIVRRDSTATVISHGEGLNKKLLVNGIGITHLTPITKIMAHFPLATLNKPPESGLIICFGMGTTFRSLASWDIKASAVELVPSVKEAFGFYFQDAESLINNPDCEIIIDDGRRFLKRTNKKFDVITIDPPPPIEAAGSSLLYSKEFYDLVKLRLTDNGILQQWFPGGERKILEAVARTLKNEFPFVRAFNSIEGWGYHFLASNKPIEIPSVESMIQKMPLEAQKDLMEWYPGKTIHETVTQILNKEVPVDSVIGSDPSVIITDNKPYNEYYFLRRKWAYVIKKFNRFVH